MIVSARYVQSCLHESAKHKTATPVKSIPVFDYMPLKRHVNKTLPSNREWIDFRKKHNLPKSWMDYGSLELLNEYVREFMTICGFSAKQPLLKLNISSIGYSGRDLHAMAGADGVIYLHIDLTSNEWQIKLCILHEVIHLFMWAKYGIARLVDGDHGPTFKKAYARVANVFWPFLNVSYDEKPEDYGFKSNYVKGKKDYALDAVLNYKLDKHYKTGIWLKRGVMNNPCCRNPPTEGYKHLQSGSFADAYVHPARSAVEIILEENENELIDWSREAMILARAIAPAEAKKHLPEISRLRIDRNTKGELEFIYKMPYYLTATEYHHVDEAEEALEKAYEGKPETTLEKALKSIMDACKRMRQPFNDDIVLGNLSLSKDGTIILRDPIFISASTEGLEKRWKSLGFSIDSGRVK